MKYKKFTENILIIKMIGWKYGTPKIAVLRPTCSVTIFSRFCDFSNIVVFGHSKL